MIALLLGLGCQSDNTIISRNDAETPVPTYGTVTGRVCDPTGYTWLEGALVYANVVDEEGYVTEMMSTESDMDGYWSLVDVPAGTLDIYVQKGNTLIEEITVDVIADRNTRLEEPACLDPSALDIAVVSGNYDDFDQVLDHMQIDDYTVIDGLDENTLTSFLTNADEMAEFDMIFFNGGFLEEGVIYDSESISNETVEAVLANLQAYVEGGGSVYASDWAYDVVEAVWPDRIDFLGADEVPNAAQLGTSQSVNATVSNHALAEFMELEEPYMQVRYDLPVWPPVVSTSSLVSTHLVSEVEYRENGVYQYQASSPLLVSFNGGGGRVVYSSFRIIANDDDELIKLMKYVMFAL